MVRNGKMKHKKRKGTGLKVFKKNKKDSKEYINKKSIFNRYKNKVKVEEALVKKKLFESKIKEKQIEYTESEEEADVYEQLLSTLSKIDKIPSKNVHSESETDQSNAEESWDDDELTENQELQMTPSDAEFDEDSSKIENETVIITNPKDNEVRVSFCYTICYFINKPLDSNKNFFQ